MKTMPLGGGLTNQCWYIQLKNGLEYVWRPVSTTAFLVGISREKEAQVLSFLQGTELAPAPVWRSKHGLLVEWIAGKRVEQISLTELTRTMVSIHRLPAHLERANLPTLNFERLVTRYWNTIQNGQIKARIEPIYQLLRRPPDTFLTQDCLCHLDLGAHNMIQTPQQFKVIDWEYSALADPRIELALICINLTHTEAKCVVSQYCQSLGYPKEALWWQSVLAWFPHVRLMVLLWYMIANQQDLKAPHNPVIFELITQLESR
ncbi:MULTISPECIES: phosphotransferase [unclassified Vibrio]|uniref:Phosphotransferase n=1 Tax=Vibrio sp. HB236076 TaxID=3232307 RepID=A0AB39HH81_9VIBR|nr:phosphotransferase [Vibrio sp. HB161653]MDP5255124.1 phosphotransferase [Vibrio sp. HB161653]